MNPVAGRKTRRTRRPLIWSLGPPSEAKLARVREGQESATLTYSGVGSTLGEHPKGFHSVTITDRVRGDREAFRRGVAAIDNWKGHGAFGVSLWPRRPPIAVGETLAFSVRALPRLPLWVCGGCRIVRVVQEENRFGFAHGTLPAHPERGEELFLVTFDGDWVEVEVSAFSRPGSWLVRLAGPLGRAVQRRAMGAYVAALIGACSR